MAMKNSRQSVRTTPRKPPAALNTTVRSAATATVSSGCSPNRTPPILIAARVTVAMIMTLKNRPR